MEHMGSPCGWDYQRIAQLPYQGNPALMVSSGFFSFGADFLDETF